MVVVLQGDKRASPESHRCLSRAWPVLSPVGKGSLLCGPSASPKIPETRYMQENVFVTERLPGPFTCWFCKTLQLVDLFSSLQLENLSVLKMVKIHFPPFFNSVVVNEPHNLKFFFLESFSTRDLIKILWKAVIENEKPFEWKAPWFPSAELFVTIEMKREAQNCTFPLCVATEGPWLQVAAALRSAGLAGAEALTLCRAQALGRDFLLWWKHFSQFIILF